MFQRITPLKKMAGLAFGLALISIPAAHAGVIYSTGFENPPFTLGSSDGQGGWVTTGSGSNVGQIESAIVESGSQALGVLPALAGGQTGPSYATAPLTGMVDVSADLLIASSSVQSEWQFAGLAPGFAPFAGGFDVFNDGSIHLITNGFTDVGAFQYNVWNTVDLLFNFNTQTFNFILNGVTLGTNIAMCGDNGPCAGANVPSFGEFYFDAFPTFDVTGANISNDLGVIDNFEIATVDATPEPASLLLFGTGLALLAGRKFARR